MKRILLAILIMISLSLLSIHSFRQLKLSSLYNLIFLEDGSENTNLTIVSPTVAKEKKVIKRIGIPKEDKNDDNTDDALENKNVSGHGYQEKPDVNIERVSYWVKGNDRHDLCDQILEKRGNDDDYFELGDIEFEMNYSYRVIGNDNGFTIGDYNVKTDSIITVPQWESSAGASDDTHNDWNVFKQSVVKHEDKHQKILEEYAQKLVTNLNDLPYFDSQQDVKRAISEEIRTIEDQMEDAHNNFDEEESEDTIFNDFCNNKY